MGGERSSSIYRNKPVRKANVSHYNQIERAKKLQAIPKSWTRRLEQHEDRVFLVLTLAIGAVVGLVVVAFIVLTGNLGARVYPPGGSPWRRLLVPVAGSLATGYLLSRYFPYARGSGIPQTKAALFAREGYIRFRTVLRISSAAPRHSPAESRSGARARPFKWAPALPPCSAGVSDSDRKG